MDQKNATYVTLTDANFQQEVLENTKPVLVDFWAPWCGPCLAMAPVIDQLAAEFQPDATIGKLNVDDYQEIAVRYGIQSIPTLILFQNGQVVDRITGAAPKAVLSQRLTNLLKAA